MPPYLFLKAVVMNLIILVFCVFMNLSCGKKINTDESMAAAEANYPTAEFIVGGQLYNGLGVIQLEKGMPYNSVNLQIQGYYKGVIRVDSERCNIHQAWSYEKSELKKIDIPGIAEESCVIDFMVIPEYPDELVQVYPFRGQLLIKVLEKSTAWEGYPLKVEAGFNKEIAFKAENGKGRVFFRGCGSTYDKELVISQNKLVLKLSEVVSLEKGICPIEGFIRVGEWVKRLSLLVWFYDQKFTALALPLIVEESGMLSVHGEAAVGIISLNDEYEIGSKAKFDFERDRQPNTLRLLTNKGRSVLCNLKGVWQCQN
jgi:hypothetical protein